MTLTVYVFENADGSPDTYTTMNPQEAKDRARLYHLRLIAQDYEFSDSELIGDWTADDPEQDADGRDVALVRDFHEGNARLIAAAPALLERLKVANRVLKVHLKYNSHRDYAPALQEAIEANEEAIRKAGAPLEDD